MSSATNHTNHKKTPRWRPFSGFLEQRTFSYKLVVCVTFLIMTLVMMQGMLSAQLFWSVGDIATRTITADRSVVYEDEQATEEKQQELLDNFEDVYEIDLDRFNNLTLVSIDRMFDRLQEILVVDESTQAAGAEDETYEERHAELNDLLGTEISDGDWSALSIYSADHVELLHQQAVALASNVMGKGVKESDLAEAKQTLLEDVDNSLAFSALDRKIVRDILDNTEYYPTSVIDQKDFRKEIILDFLKEKNCDPKTLNVIVGRGGLLKPIPGGTYAVSDALLADLKAGVQGQHASNLGGILAREIGDSLGVPSYIVDPVVVDELTDKARISGMPELPRRSIFHALNQKAVARRFAKENGKRYEDLNLIVIHMGGGVSVGAHDHGKVVDVNNILDGEGCFSPERSGTVPVGDLVKMCFSGKYTQKEVYKKICGNGGFNGYLHTNDAREVGKMAESGNALAKQVWEAFFYQIAKDAGAMAAVLHGKVDQIILTGGIAYNPFTAKTLTEYLGWIAPVTTYPGEDELLALCQGALRVMTGEEEAKNY